jgi:hypothetical protein
MNWDELQEKRRQLRRNRGEEIVQLRLQGVSFAEIGRRLGLSGSRVKQLLDMHMRHAGMGEQPMGPVYNLIKQLGRKLSQLHLKSTEGRVIDVVDIKGLIALVEIIKINMKDEQ